MSQKVLLKASFKLRIITDECLRCRLRPFGLQNQVIVTISIESFNCRSGVFLVVEVNVSETFAKSGVLVLRQIHLRFLAKFVREVLEIGVGRRLGEIGNANGRGVVATLSTGVLLLILDEGRNVFSRLGGRSLGCGHGDRLGVENLLDVRSCVAIRASGREVTAVAETTLGELI